MMHQKKPLVNSFKIMYVVLLLLILVLSFISETGKQRSATKICCASDLIQLRHKLSKTAV